MARSIKKGPYVDACLMKKVFTLAGIRSTATAALWPGGSTNKAPTMATGARLWRSLAAAWLRR